MEQRRSSDPYPGELGAADADITSHDAYAGTLPHATFAELRRSEPVSWCDES